MQFGPPFVTSTRNSPPIPGIQAVSQTWGAVPLSGDDEQLFWLEGQPKPANENDMNWAIDYIVEPDYLKAMGIPLLARPLLYSPGQRARAARRRDR